MQGIIYKTTCLVNGKIYIGQSKHNNENYFGSGMKILLALREYGKGNFIKEILKCNVKTQKKLNILEKIFIKKFDSTNSKIGYKILPGSSRGFGNKWNEEQKRLMREKMVGRYDGKNNPNHGNKWSKKQKEAAQKRLKISGANVGKNNPMFGKKRITNGKMNTVINSNEELPEGFRFGMTRGLKKKK